MPDPWQEPPRGGHPDSGFMAVAGADQLRAMLAGRISQPPISRLTGMRRRKPGPVCRVRTR